MLISRQISPCCSLLVRPCHFLYVGKRLLYTTSVVQNGKKGGSPVLSCGVPCTVSCDACRPGRATPRYNTNSVAFATWTRLWFEINPRIPGKGCSKIKSIVLVFPDNPQVGHTFRVNVVRSGSSFVLDWMIEQNLEKSMFPTRRKTLRRSKDCQRCKVSSREDACESR